MNNDMHENYDVVMRSSVLLEFQEKCLGSYVDDILVNLYLNDFQDLNLDLDSLVSRLNYKIGLGLSVSPNVEYLFCNVGTNGRIIILEMLASNGLSKKAFDLISKHTAGEEAECFKCLLYVRNAYLRLSFQEGLTVARYIIEKYDNPIVIKILQYVVYEFISEKELSLFCQKGARSNIIVNMKKYIDYLRNNQKIDIGDHGLQYGPEDCIGFVSKVREFRFSTLDVAVNSILSAYSQVSDWHLRMALIAALKAAIEHGYTDDFESFTMVAATLIKRGTECQAIQFFNQIDFSAREPISQKQFRRIQMVIGAAGSRKEFNGMIDKALNNISDFASPYQASTLEKMKLKQSLLKKKNVSRVFGSERLLRPAYSKHMNKKKSRVAVCISGQLRSFERNWENIKRAMIDPLRADVFLSTWDNVGFGEGFQKDVSRFMPIELLRILPEEYKQFEKFIATFPQLYKHLSSYHKDALSLLNGLDGISAWNIFSEDDFIRYCNSHYDSSLLSNKNNENHLKMFFTMQDSFDQMQQSCLQFQNKYDVVFRMRPDMNVSYFSPTSCNIDNLEADKVYVHHYHDDGLADQFAFGNMKAMAAYMSVFETIHESKTFDAYEIGSGVGGEPGILDHLLHKGVRFKKCDIIDYKLSSQVIDTSDIIEMMLGDVEGDETLLEILRNFKSELR